MATQICPNCKADSFTWTTDEDENNNLETTWGCSCGYSAKEDESQQGNCDDCKKFSKMKLEDENKIYWWCCSCNKIEIINAV
ncbi:hypothetical protein [Flavobacterium sp.]|uniref:hypothetical protein n=1 Tax=Flavobacterium sp. TaxID=239 RepID=UPI0039E2F3AC